MDSARSTEADEHKGDRDYQMWREKGDCHAALGHYSQAQRCYQKAAALEPDEPAPYVGSGVASLHARDLEDAEVAFRVACRLDPRCALAYAGLAEVARQRRDLARAADLYARSLALDGGNIMALLGLFQVSRELRTPDRAIPYLEAYLAIHRGACSVEFALAVLYQADGRPRQAKRLLVDILASDPENPDAANLLEEVEHDLVSSPERRA